MQGKTNNNKQNEWQTRLLAQGLDQLGQPLMLVSSRGEVVYTSASASTILDEQRGIRVVESRVCADRDADNQRLQKAIANVIEENGAQDSESVCIHRDGCAKPLMLSVNKMPKTEEERREGHHALILIKDLNLNQTYWLDRLKEEYGLAPREVECVALLAEGNDLSDVAAILDIGKETVRHYMKNIYKKMKVHKQHELVSLALEYRRNR